ncbi:hypothetical protein D3C84_542660 [compost metagenome]
MLHGLDGEVLAKGGAVATGIHAGNAGLQLCIDQDALAVTLQLPGQRVAQGAVVEGLADGLENRIGCQAEGFPGGAQAAFVQVGAGKQHAIDPALLVELHLLRLGPGQQPHLRGLGDGLFVFGSAHVRHAAAVHQVDVTGAQAGHLHSDVDGRIAGTQDNAAVSQGQGGQVVGLAQFADVARGGEHAGGGFVGQAQLAAGGQADAEEYGVELLAQ